MKIVSFFNVKGGVGKTTLTILSAIALSKEGSKVLIIDADTQANLTQFLYKVSHNDKTMFDFYSNFAEDIVVQLVTDPGDEVVEEHKYFGLREGVFTYDLGRFPKGRFYLRVLVGGVEKFKKRIRLKE